MKKKRGVLDIAKLVEIVIVKFFINYYILYNSEKENIGELISYPYVKFDDYFLYILFILADIKDSKLIS